MQQWKMNLFWMSCFFHLPTVNWATPKMKNIPKMHAEGRRTKQMFTLKWSRSPAADTLYVKILHSGVLPAAFFFDVHRHSFEVHQSLALWVDIKFTGTDTKWADALVEFICLVNEKTNHKKMFITLWTRNANHPCSLAWWLKHLNKDV